jgi:hypothetical protein
VILGLSYLNGFNLPCIYLLLNLDKQGIIRQQYNFFDSLLWYFFLIHIFKHVTLILYNINFSLYVLLIHYQSFFIHIANTFL